MVRAPGIDLGGLGFNSLSGHITFNTSEVKGNPQQRPVEADSTAAQGVHLCWTWRARYGAIYWGDCVVCTEYICQLDEAVWDDNPSVVIALREIEQHT